MDFDSKMSFDIIDLTVISYSVTEVCYADF